jgi:hypothetical protein
MQNQVRLALVWRRQPLENLGGSNRIVDQNMDRFLRLQGGNEPYVDRLDL